MTLKDAENKLVACEPELDKLQEEAPFLQFGQLREILDKARRQGIKNKAKAILAILRKEHDRKKNRRIKAGFGKPASNPVICVSRTP